MGLYTHTYNYINDKLCYKYVVQMHTAQCVYIYFIVFRKKQRRNKEGYIIRVMNERQTDTQESHDGLKILKIDTQVT